MNPGAGQIRRTLQILSSTPLASKGYEKPGGLPKGLRSAFHEAATQGGAVRLAVIARFRLSSW